LPDLIGILFLVRGDADEDDIKHCFDPLGSFFQEVDCKDRTILQDVRGIHKDSRIYFSSRVLVLPFIEIRLAKQEDHDDLADVFNSQSETVTEAYGEYFIAELIAAQSDNNKALVAQVKDKAVGLMGLSKEVDVKLLHQCFELDSFDNLLKPEYMDAIRARRELIIEQKQREAENQRISELRRLKEETMKCNIIAQRIALQEYLIEREKDITDTIEEHLAKTNEDLAKEMSTEFVIEMIKEWLSGFTIQQPSEYFYQHPTDDNELQCNIQDELEFMISTLEIFGLPIGYMTGNGHFADWGKEKKDDKLSQARKRQLAMNKKKKGKQNKAFEQLKKKYAANKNDDKEEKPKHFDLEPIKKALKKFCLSNGDIRSQVRQIFKQESKVVRSVFIDEYEEASFKKCIDIHELSTKL